MIGTRLANRYEITSELGRGGMGVVYRARDPLLNRDVAVKLVSSTDLTPEMEERFQREAQLVAQMDHPAIVPIYDLGRHEGSLFFVMPLVSGTNLLRLIRDQSLRLGDVVDIGIQVADALDYSHSRGVVHRDIKPANVMVTREEGATVRCRVMDFGLAHATTESRLTKTGTLVGTVAYLSPEQVASRAFDGRSDIYSFGVVLYECLVGEPPFTGEVQSILYRIVHEIPQPPRSLGAEIREELQDIVLRCLEKDPNKRPQKASQVAEALRRHRASLHSDEFRMSVVLSASRVIPRPAAMPFAGREKEFAELQRRLNAAIGGECQFAVVAGEPGIGKTRLLEELKTLAAVRRIRVLYGRFVEQNRSFSYQGFCELIEDYFQSRDPGSSGERPDLSDLAPDLIALFPQLSEISELRAAVGGDSRIAAPAAERKAEDRIQVFELMARTLTRIAAGKPLVLILENLHGAEVSIEALEYIVRRLRSTPTLIVGSYRQTETDKRHPLTRMLESFADDPRFVTLTLGPFSPSEHRSLVESLVGAERVSDALAQRLRDATEGNPFFTKELVRSLVESGGIARDDTGAWSFSKETELSADALPATIQQAVEKRIERLPEATRALLSVAAVLGRTFDSKDLAVLAEDAKDVDDELDRLVREGMLEEERESRGDRLTFSSGVVRDVLYAALSRRKRRSLHRGYAELLEKRHGGRLERVYPELVHHYSQADVPEKTVEYGLLLARKSLDSFGAEDAIRVARIALDYLEDAEDPADRALEGETRLLLSRAYRMAGNIDAAVREADAALRVFDAEGQTARAAGAALLAAEAAWQARRVDEARGWVERGLESARASGDSNSLARLLTLAVTLANIGGEYARAAAFQAQIEALAGRDAAATGEIPRGGTLVVAVANPVAATEPGLYETSEEHEVLANVFETLMTTDATGNLAPALCEKWSLGADTRSVRLVLRPGVSFSDGTGLTAETVKASFERSIRLSKDQMPAAFVAIHGVAEFLEGKTNDVSGIVAASSREVEIRLEDPLPIFPSLLTDPRTAIVAAAGSNGGTRVLGTGFFRVAAHAPDRVVLERNPRHAGEPARVDRIEFRASLAAPAIADGLRRGELDIVRDLAPKDLEEILRQPRFRAGLVENPKKNTYFAVFHAGTPAGGNAALRRALAGAARVQDLVWSTLGRFALPATGLIPPGILGHDPGRRQPHLSREKAIEMIRGAGLEPPLKLKASVHPILLDQYAGLTEALFRVWADLGVEVEIATKNMADFIESWHPDRGYDVTLGRWIADYDDPDNFTFTLFHSGSGAMREYFSSPETDRILEEARGETRPAARESLYRKFEHALLDPAIFVPLFHEVDYRIGSPRVIGLQLRSASPYVNYPEVGKTEAASKPAAVDRPATGGVLQVPLQGVVRDIDPVHCETQEQAEVVPSLFETLTRAIEGTRIVPWLASEVLVENDGRRYRFRLRANVSFHDGRRLTARDVRSSWERLLASSSVNRWLLAPIRGSRRIFDGQASDLEGFHIVSPWEFFVDLDSPVAFFPAVIAYTPTAVVPEGTGSIEGTDRRGVVGTGPFRLTRFESGRRLEMERNPHYWREGYPKSDGLVFRFGVSPEEARNDYVAGRVSLTSELIPADVETLRHDARFASCYREEPSLSTYFAALNRFRGPFRDAETRRRLCRAVDAAPIVRRTLGRLFLPARGVIPPGLLGYSPPGSDYASGAHASTPSDSSVEATVSREAVELTANVHPIFFGELSGFFRELSEALREIGYRLRPLNKTMAEYMDLQRRGEGDLSIGRWNADYADSDNFVHTLFHSAAGFFGRYVGMPELDELAERGRAETDPRVRDAIYREVEEILSREGLLIPFFYSQVYCFARPEVQGLGKLGSNPIVAYENLWIRR